jgi:hypothetical protein
MTMVSLHYKWTGNVRMQTAGNNYQFWSSSNAFYIYATVLISALLRQGRILHGVSFLLLLQLGKIGSKWIQYVRTDPQYDLFVKFCRGYFRVVMQEYRDLLSGKYGRMKMALAQLALRFAVYESRAYIRSHGVQARKIIRHQFVGDLRNFIRRPPNR